MGVVKGAPNTDVRSELVKIYEVHKPIKIQDVDTLLKEWKGHESELLTNVKKKYLNK